MRLLPASLGLFVACAAISSCAHGQSASTDASETVDFKDVQAVFDAKCVSCHGGDDAPGELSLDSWSNIFVGGDHGEAVIPYRSGASLLVRLAESNAHPAVEPSNVLSQFEIDAIRSWIDGGAKNADGKVPYSDSRNLLYVCNQGAATISVVDMDANVVIRVIDLLELGFTTNAKPHHIAVEPSGLFWYVSLIGDDAILKFDRQNNLVGRVDFERPGMLVVDPDSDVLIVGRSMKAVNPPQRIGLVQRSSMEIEEVDVFIARPHALAVSVDGRFLYTASLAANQIVTMNLETEEVDLYNIPGSVHTLVQFAVAPDGKTMAVGGQLTGKLLFFDITSPHAPELVDSVTVGAAPWHPVFHPDGSAIYFGNKGASTVTVVDADSRAVAAIISGRGIAQPHGSAISRDGAYLYISSNNLNGKYIPRYDLGDNAKVGTLVVIDTRSRRIVKVLEVGANATGIGTRKAS